MIARDEAARIGEKQKLRALKAEMLSLMRLAKRARDRYMRAAAAYRQAFGPDPLGFDPDAPYKGDAREGPG